MPQGILVFKFMSNNQLNNSNFDKKLVNNVCFAFFVSGACSQSLGPLIPYLRDTFGFGYDVSGVLLSINSIGNLITVLLAGILPSFLGRRKSLLVTSVWMSVGFLIFSVTSKSIALIILAFLLTGLARGGTSTFANTMISTLGGSLATKGYNKSHGSYALGALLSPIVIYLGAVYFLDFNWRYVTIILCAFAVIQFLLYCTMKLPEENKPKGVKSIDRSFFSDKRFWFGTSMLFFYISAEYAIAGWLVTYFQDMNILSDDTSQLMNSLFWLAIFLGRIVGARIVGKISRSKLLLIDGTGLLISFLFMFLSRSPITVTIGLLGVGLFMATIYPTAFSFGSDSISGNDFGCSLMSFIASFGGIITPALVGIVASKAGINAGMGLVVLVVCILLLSIVLSVRSSKKPI